jgi:DNA-repair protein complementing XP-A cells
MNPEENPKCVHCKSMELDLQMRAVFKVFVCGKCKGERPDEYSLLTKTECREDYLLTERTSFLLTEWERD